MKKVTLLQSTIVRLQISLALLILALSFHMWVTSALLLFAVGWYAQKEFGEV